MKVTIIEYRPEWQKMFEDEKKFLQTALGEVSAQIEHIGSTAVAGLAAKPVIDLMVGLEDFSTADNFVPKIEALAYEYLKKYEAVMPFRRFFVKEQDGRRTHQIHLVAIGSEFWERLILFRDYLRQHHGVAAKYASLKKQLAAREWADVNEYAEAKTEFIREIENEARRRVGGEAQHNKLIEGDVLFEPTAS
ncbi:MAG: hypothetical protein QOC96_918 [Acidobacteriota bacterium]|jgi:GrpB-like predicted nucleotidyltransferase (UPF0157 family)|nr:hypothetical protein [Acidobacteriota bacterium]